MKRNKIIYVYSTKTYRFERTILTNNGPVHYKPWYKIGMTTQEVHVRVNEQDGTSNPEKLDLLWWYEIPVNYNISALELEQKIHNFFRNKGREVRLDKNREWFECELHEVKSAIAYILGPDAHKKELKLYPDQEHDYKKLKNLIGKGVTDILLNRKPRSGKTFIMYQYLIDYKPKNVLLFTNYPVLNKQWIEGANKIKGIDYDFINMSTDGIPSKKVLYDEKPNFVICSFQDSKQEGIFTKAKFKELLKLKWDAIIIDEVHCGKETDKTDKLLQKLEYDLLIGLSATPTRNLIRGSFLPENTITYGVIEENYYKKKHPHIYHLPNISFFLYHTPEDIKKEMKYFEDKLLSLRKITQDIKPDTCKWIPIVPFDRIWTDEELYKYFDLTPEEIKLIEETVK